ncbi:MAG: acetyl-CoA carboxylase biotin carboxyl carrier protein [Phycisphaerae bacterium]|nr:acetyl-CoA carboxylase biotin carboxyl carrier protein [Phycisphaerae bacterium]
MFDLDQIRELIRLMAENDIAEVSVRSGDDAIELKRIGSQAVVQTMAAPVASALVAAPPPATAAAPATPDESQVPIVSPMVGTFYTAPDPNSPPYVTIGSEVTEDTVVCIVEAMKVFNEIKAEVRGTIEKILVSNADGVDYGQPLFMVRKR